VTRRKGRGRKRGRSPKGKISTEKDSTNKAWRRAGTKSGPKPCQKEKENFQLKARERNPEKGTELS